MKPQIRFLHRVSLAVRKKTLSTIEIAIINQMIADPFSTYVGIAMKIDYSYQHVQGSASGVYDLLRIHTGLRVCKGNFLAVLDGAMKQQSETDNKLFTTPVPMFSCLSFGANPPSLLPHLSFVK